MKNILITLVKKYAVFIMFALFSFNFIQSCNRGKKIKKINKEYIYYKDSINNLTLNLRDSINILKTNNILLEKDVKNALDRISHVENEKESYKDIAKRSANKSITVTNKIERNE
ncbi:MAG: hypothetical protein RSE41_02640 [Clostridia bacterium]